MHFCPSVAPEHIPCLVLCHIQSFPQIVWQQVGPEWFENSLYAGGKKKILVDYYARRSSKFILHVPVAVKTP